MKLTRRGLFGIMGGTVAATLPVGWLESATRTINEPVVPDPARTFKVTRKMLGPFVPGDVVRHMPTGILYLVTKPQAPRMRKRPGAGIFGMRGTGEPLERVERPADPGWKARKDRDPREPEELVAVPFLRLDGPATPLRHLENRKAWQWESTTPVVVRVGQAYPEAR